MGQTASTLTHEEYLGKRYFEPLDGLRAISVLLVISVHLGDTMYKGTWHWLQGQGGVSVFFVLSGFLITTLALREERQNGSLSLKAFYVRRTLRIFPAYYYLIVLLTLLIFASGNEAAHKMFFAALPYYLTYTGEFAPRAHFFHSWSLGVEEKFYLLWPMLCFVLLKGKPKLRIAVAALLAFALPLIPVVSIWKDWNTYPRIFMGCLLALLLADERSYGILRRWASGWRVYVGLILAVSMHFAADHVPTVSGGIVEPAFTIGIALLLVGVVLGNPPWARFLALRPMRFVGQRAYGIYLMHVLCVWGVESVISSDSIPVVGPAVVYLVVFLVSIGVADVLYRLIERPGVRAGHKLSAKILGGSIDTPSPAPKTRPVPASA